MTKITVTKYEFILSYLRFVILELSKNLPERATEEKMIRITTKRLADKMQSITGVLNEVRKNNKTLNKLLNRHAQLIIYFDMEAKTKIILKKSFKKITDYLKRLSKNV